MSVVSVFGLALKGNPKGLLERDDWGIHEDDQSLCFGRSSRNADGRCSGESC